STLFAIIAVVMRSASAHNSTDKVLRSALRLLINSAYILTDDSQKEQHNAGEKGDSDQQCCEPLWRYLQHQFDVDCIKHINHRDKHDEGAKQSRRSDRHDGKCENSIERQFHKSQHTVFAFSGVPLRSL